VLVSLDGGVAGGGRVVAGGGQVVVWEEDALEFVFAEVDPGGVHFRRDEIDGILLGEGAY
jgi:hypothetical protein